MCARIAEIKSMQLSTVPNPWCQWKMLSSLLASIILHRRWITIASNPNYEKSHPGGDNQNTTANNNIKYKPNSVITDPQSSSLLYRLSSWTQRWGVAWLLCCCFMLSLRLAALKVGIINSLWVAIAVVHECLIESCPYCGVSLISHFPSILFCVISFQLGIQPMQAFSYSE